MGNAGAGGAPAEEKDDAKATWPGLVDHVGWLIPAAVAVATVLRLAAVSRADVNTALALLAHGSTASALLATALTGLFAVIAIAPLLAQQYLGARGQRVPIWLVAVALIVNLIAAPSLIFYVTVVSSLGALGAAYGPGPVRRFLRRELFRVGSLSDREVSARVAVGALGAFALLSVVSPSMWVPTERIEIEAADDLVGYVLSPDGAQTPVLTDKDRKVVYVDTDLIEARQVCERKGSSSLDAPFLSVVGLWEDPARYPRCPKD